MIIGRRAGSAFEGLDTHEQLVVGRDFVLLFGAVVEVDSGESAVGVDLNPEALHEFASEGLEAVVLEVEDDFVPALLQLKGHRALEGLDAGDRLVVAAHERPFDVLVVQEGHLEPEVLVELSQKEVHF